jgi:hypothetical protein
MYLLRTVHPFRLAALALAGSLLLPAAGARADTQSTSGSGASASLMFKIIIPVVLRMKVLSPPALRVTREDIKRGYVETGSAQDIQVTCNTNTEYALRLELTMPRFRRVTVTESRQSQSFGAEGLTLYRPPAPPSTNQATHRFNYRFELPADLVPGDYPWPLSVSLVQL